MPAKTEKNRTAKKTKQADPVLPDQAGRMMPGDPLRSPRVSKEEAIRVRAYEKYLQRGKKDGRAIDDWIEAEEEISQT